MKLQLKKALFSQELGHNTFCFPNMEEAYKNLCSKNS